MKRGSTIEKEAEIEDWILDYIRHNIGVSVTDELFHEAFYQKFGGKRKTYPWGAQPVAQAMKMLKLLYDMGELRRSPVSLGNNWQPGFPRWNYVYFIREEK